MKQIIQSYKTGEMKLDETPTPQVGPGAVLVQNYVSLVSAGTEKMLVDLAKKSLLGKARSRPDLVKKVIEMAKKEGIGNTITKVRSKLDTPIPLGYSCAGIVREVGFDVDEFQVGDLVACGGAGYANHADYNVVPKNLCVKLPNCGNKTLSFDEASFATVGAIALQGVRQAGLTLGENVCVIGLGLIGQMTVQLCKANGCQVIGADIDGNKLALAQQLGADSTVKSAALESEVLAFTNGVGADTVIITAAAHGNQLVQLAGEISRIKGRVVVVGFVGLDLPREVFYKKELDLKMSMSYGPGRYDAEYEERGHDYPLPYVRWTEQRNMQTILELCASGKLNVKSLVTHRFPFEKALDAYDLISSGKEPYLGVLLEYAQSEPQDAIRLSDKEYSTGEKGVRLGVIGAGNFAKGVLLPRLAKISDTSLVGIATGRGMTAKAVGEQFGFQYCADSGEKIIEDDGVNTILVATRHDSHAEYVVKALAAGKNVFVEKPLCLNLGELKEILNCYKGFDWSDSFDLSEGKAQKKTDIGAQQIEPMQQTNPIQQVDQPTEPIKQIKPIEPIQPVLFVGFNRRFSPFIQKTKKVLKGKSSPVFAIYTVNAGMIPKDSWIQDPRFGGGRIVGEVCHFVDTLRFLCDSPVKSVQANCIQTDDRTQVNRDSVAITLQYENGSIGQINYYALGNSDYPKERLEVSADKATVVLDDYQRIEIYGRKKEKLKTKQDKGFDAEIEAFIQSVTKGGGPPIPLAELIETTLVAFAIHQSLNKGIIVHLGDFARQCELPMLIN